MDFVSIASRFSRTTESPRKDVTVANSYSDIDTWIHLKGDSDSASTDCTDISVDISSPRSDSTDAPSSKDQQDSQSDGSASATTSPGFCSREHINKVRAENPFASTTHLNILACLLELCHLSSIDDPAARLLLRTIEFLHRCRYSVEDICSIIAHAAAYFKDVYGQRGPYMDATEVSNVLVLNMFVAHCYVQDETCPLTTWHRFLFRDYCTVNELNSAVLRVMQLRGHLLRVEESTLDYHYDLLCKSSQLDVEA